MPAQAKTLVRGVEAPKIPTAVSLYPLGRLKNGFGTALLGNLQRKVELPVMSEGKSA